MSVSVGIDVSVKTVDVVVLEKGQFHKSLSYPQTPKGRDLLAKKLAKLKPESVVMEATGMYYIDLAKALHDAGLPVCVINPKSFHHFAKLKLKGTKTDPIDAALLAEYGVVLKPRCWVPPSNHRLQIRSMGRHINRLVGARAKAKNRLHALESTETSPRLLVEDERLGITQLDQRIDMLRKEAIRLLQEEPELERAYKSFSEAVGFGDASILAILAELCVLPESLKSNQVSRHAGLDVRHSQSGSSVNTPGRLNRTGNAYLRTALFYPAMSARTHDETTKAFYDSMVSRGKKKKQALVAIMRKYLTGLWAVYRSGEQFDPSLLFDVKTREAA